MHVEVMTFVGNWSDGMELVTDAEYPGFSSKSTRRV